LFELLRQRRPIAVRQSEVDQSDVDSMLGLHQRSGAVARRANLVALRFQYFSEVFDKVRVVVDQQNSR